MRGNKFLKYALALLLLCWHMAGFAADTGTLYQIEIIVFSHITPAGLQSEYWPALPPLVMPPKAIELSSDQIVAQAQWQLQQTHQLLQKNNYPILLHLAWQETADSARQGTIIHLTGGNAYDNNLQQVSGFVAIRLEHYFSVHFNLRFLMPWADIKDLNLPNITHDSDNPYITFQINEHLRMRSKELNYIDHPLYGILIEIVPVTPPKPAV